MLEANDEQTGVDKPVKNKQQKDIFNRWAVVVRFQNLLSVDNRREGECCMHACHSCVQRLLHQLAQLVQFCLLACLLACLLGWWVAGWHVD